MNRVRGGTVVAFVAGWLLIWSMPAGAHALLRSSQPAKGAQLRAAPRKIVLDFTETPDPQVSSIGILSASGAAVASGDPATAPGNTSALEIPVGHLGPGVYTVTWRVVSKIDGHLSAGSFAFSVGKSSGAPSRGLSTSSPTTPGPAPLGVIGRWAFYWGLALVLAAAVTSQPVLTHTDPRRDRWVALAWAVALIGLILMVLSIHSTIGVGFGQLLSSTTGHNLAEQAVGVGLCGIGVLIIVAARRGVGYLVAGIGALVAMWFHASGSHAALHMTWFNVPVQFLHMAAVGLWVGGLVWLLVSIRSGPDVERAAALRRFSWLFGVALGVVALTGTLRALDETGGIAKWREALSSSFGVTLVIKILLFLGLAALGARNRYVNVPAFGRDPDRSGSLNKTVTAEVVLAASILGLTGVLSQLPPPVDIASATPASSSSSITVSGHDFATSVRVRLTITPGFPGQNRFQAGVRDFDTGRAVPARTVTLGFTLPARDVGTSSLKLEETSPGRWVAKGTNLSLAGRWMVTVTVQKGATAVEVPLIVQTRSEPQQISAQRVPGQPTIYTIALPTSGKLQTYIDPGHPGINNVHFTFFAASGGEERIASARAEAVDPQGRPRSLKLIRFDKGHFVANIQLTPGDWAFKVRARTSTQAIVNGHFSQNITQGRSQ
jgi:copper transport protein